jgi:hypothetical protein
LKLRFDLTFIVNALSVPNEDLQQMRKAPEESLQGTLPPRTVLPLIEGEFLADAQVVKEYLLVGEGHVVVVDVGVGFVTQLHAAHIEVRGAYHRQVVVALEGLAMDKLPLTKQEAYASL